MSGNCPDCGFEYDQPTTCKGCCSDLNPSVSFNRMTPNEIELSAILAEECGEVVQVIGKILRHGFWSHHPSNLSGPTNYDLLVKEIGDVLAAIELIGLPTEKLERAKQDKLVKIGRYLHHTQFPNKSAEKQS